MRLFTLIPVTFIPVIFAVTSLAAAQNWQEYSYPDYSLRVSFPADPQIEAIMPQALKPRLLNVRSTPMLCAEREWAGRAKTRHSPL